MTTQEKIESIAKEIERRREKCADIAADERNEEVAEYYRGKEVAYDETSALIASLQQEQPEWSEEDDNALNYIHELISFGFTENFMDAQTAADMREWLNNHLKSIYPRPHWKPNEVQPEVDLEKFTEKVKTFQGRYKHPEIVSIKGAMAFMARMFYQYPNTARLWYDRLPKSIMD